MSTDELKSPEQLRRELSVLRARVAQLEEALGHLDRIERSARMALQYAEGIIETVREPLLVLDAGLNILSANRSFYDTFRVQPGDTLGKPIYEIGNRQWDIPRLRTLLEHILPENSRIEAYEVEHVFHVIGRKVMLLNARRVVRDDIGTQTILLAIEDVTDRRQTENQWIAAALTDPLTGLHNRRGLFALAEKLVPRFRREGKGFHLLYIDLDNLKAINDRLGHEEGDRALSDVAGILSGCFRESDIIARIGGDEFVVVPVGIAGDDPGTAVSRLQKAVESRNLAGTRPYTLSLSVGIAHCEPGSDHTLEQLLYEGDIDMYDRKRRRRAT